MTWKQIQDGFGLQRVPKEWAGEMGCCMCSPDFPTAVLYTPEPISYDGSQRGLRRMLNRMRGNCYCKTHAILMFDDSEVTQ